MEILSVDEALTEENAIRALTTKYQTKYDYEISDYVKYSINLDVQMLADIGTFYPDVEFCQREAVLIAKTEMMFSIVKELGYIALDLETAIELAHLIRDKDSELSDFIKTMVKRARIEGKDKS